MTADFPLQYTASLVEAQTINTTGDIDCDGTVVVENGVDEQYATLNYSFSGGLQTITCDIGANSSYTGQRCIWLVLADFPDFSPGDTLEVTLTNITDFDVDTDLPILNLGSPLSSNICIIARETNEFTFRLIPFANNAANGITTAGFAIRW
jgi:hypothetical protein